MVRPTGFEPATFRVGVIRRSNAKPLRRSRFVDYAQFKTETMEKPRAVALQRFSVVLGIFQNSSQIVVIPNESLKWEPKGDVTSVKVTNLLKSRNTTGLVVFRLFKFLECNVIEDRSC